jgi:cytochrome oxidase Cu insertion factor (SCO1/SenC/PrrC family)
MSRFPVLIVGVWLVATLSWWAFAFMPVPSGPPDWLTAARYACFGTMERGLPEAAGWMLLVLAPATFLGVIVAVWGGELRPSLRAVARTRIGRCACAAVALAVLVEGGWVVRKVQAARTAAAWAETIHDDAALPADYPRQTHVAPEVGLVDQHGRTVSLASLRGRPVAITFVFAHCQTLCPLIVETLREAFPPDGPGEVLLVTLDPWRDTPSSLPGIARQWGLPRNFRVLSGRRVDDVLAVAGAYGVPFERNEQSGDIAHPGLVFLIDTGGRLAYTFNNPSPTWIREALGRIGRTHVRLD